jgi:hypothetical protein
VGLATPSIAGVVFKLAVAGEQVGFTVEEMMRLLNAGVTVEILLTLIEWKLKHAPVEADQLRSSRWVTIVCVTEHGTYASPRFPSRVSANSPKMSGKRSHCIQAFASAIGCTNGWVHLAGRQCDLITAHD